MTVQRLKFHEIPLDVWKAVREKWSEALRRGWSPDLWTPCAMCRFMSDACEDASEDDEAFECDLCPLNPAWCNGRESSKLFRRNASDDLRWERTVSLFVRMCDRIIAKLEEGQWPAR